MQGCSLVSRAQWLGQRFQKWCCSRVAYKLFCWILIAADLRPCHFNLGAAVGCLSHLFGLRKGRFSISHCEQLGSCFPQGGKEVPLCLRSSWSTNCAFPLVVRACFVKPLILWSSVSSSTLKSALSIDILQRCQGESLLKSQFPNFFFCCCFSFNYLYNLSQKKKLKLILIEIYQVMENKCYNSIFHDTTVMISFYWTVSSLYCQLHCWLTLLKAILWKNSINPFRFGQNDKMLPIVGELQQSDFFLFFWISQVLLAKRKLDGKYYAVKVLQKKIVLNRKEVNSLLPPTSLVFSLNYKIIPVYLLISYFLQQKHIMAERNVLLKNVKHPFLVGLHYSFQTTEKLYFVLDFVNGGEVCDVVFCIVVCLFY